MLAVAAVAAGCGSGDNNDQQSGAGAPSNAKGSAEGGLAVEAGKQRDPKEVQQEKETFSEEPPPVQLQTDDLSDFHVSKPTLVFIHSQKEMNQIIRKLGVKKSDVAPVQFETRQAVLVQMPTEAKGTMMQIQDVSVRNGVITVRAARLRNGKGCPTAKYKPNPYNLVETRKMTESKSALKVEDVATSPC